MFHLLIFELCEEYERKERAYREGYLTFLSTCLNLVIIFLGFSYILMTNIDSVILQQ